MRRKAEVTLLGVLAWIVTTLIGAYIEKEYKVTNAIESSIELNSTSTKVYPKVILTDEK